MPTLLIASLQPGAGRTTIAAGLGASLVGQNHSVRLLRIRAGTGAEPNAEDDAQSLAATPGCDAPAGAVSEQDAQAQAAETDTAGAVCLIEAAAGSSADLAARFSAKVALVSAHSDEEHLSALTSEAKSLGERLLGVILTRQPDRRLGAMEAALRERDLTCLAVLPEDRLLAAPNIREITETLHASLLVERRPPEQVLEFIMLGPISADPGQPYFLQHGSKAVVNRFDKMDLHLAALATAPECLILTGGQQPSPYLIDRLGGSDQETTVMLAPEGAVRTMELLDDLYGHTRFAGPRKLTRAIELLQDHLDSDTLAEAIR